MSRGRLYTPATRPDGHRDQWSWQDDAACGNNRATLDDTQSFTMPPIKHVTKDLVKRFCAECPVVAECRAWADEDLYFVGVAGGRGYNAKGRRTEAHEDRVHGEATDDVQ